MDSFKGRENMATDLENGRPNIRIEINNTEPMEVDKSEEEGEIRDTMPDQWNKKKLNVVTMGNSMDIFKKALDNFSEVNPAKLQERAKRFDLKQEDINTFTEPDLHSLYASLGITADNVEQVRFEAIHMRSSNEMDIKDVMAYFMEYVPTTVEWVDDESYNVIWQDKLSTARALFHISQVVRNMPVRVVSEHIIDSFILDENIEKDTSLSSEHRQIELRDDNVEDVHKLSPQGQVDISAINIPIPPGYWRLGNKPINSFSVLMRFSLKTDKKPYQIDKCSKYYKSISLNRNKEYPYRGIFSRNKDIRREVSGKNPWGVLAKNWDEDLMFREKEHYNSQVELTKNALPVPEPENPELRVRLIAKRREGKINQESKILSTLEKEQSDQSEQENESKCLKMPRMRMYADEEEEKIKRRKLLQVLKKQTEKLKKTEIPSSDLRNILKITNRRSKVHIKHDEELDLSLNLKNRSRKLVFTVAQEGIRTRGERQHIKDRLDKPKAYPVLDKKSISPIFFKSGLYSDKYKERSSSKHQEERERRKSPVKKRKIRHADSKYDDRMYSSRTGNDSNYHVEKPKSKVALVIKTQKKPSVASAIQSRSRKFDTSSSSSEEDSSSEESDSGSSDEGSEQSTSTSEDSESDSSETHRPRVQGKRLNRVPLKVEIKNDQYNRKK